MLFVGDTKPVIAPRRLTPREREIVQRALVECRVVGPALARESAEKTVIVPRAPSLAEVRGVRSLFAHVALSSRADGIALGTRVFIRREHFGAHGSLPIDLVAHELTHVAQFLRDGPIAFYVRYGRDYAAGRARGWDDHRAYLAISYEVEARAVARAALR